MQIKELVHVSRRGSQREFNEDAIWVDPHFPMVAISDGMNGGDDSAAQAALWMARSLLPEIDEHRGRISEERSTQHRLALGRLMDELFNQAGHAVREKAVEQGNARLTSTLMLMTLVRNFAYIAHVGNSPAYLLRDGVLSRLNEDHSLAAYRYRRGRTTWEEYERSKNRYVLYQALGTGMEIEVDLAEVRLMDGDVMLLCSDGLVRAFDEEVIRESINPKDLSASSKLFEQMLEERGAPDDTTWCLFSLRGEEGDEPLEAVSEAMNRVFLFQGMSEPELLVIAPYLEELVFDEGEIIMNKGDVGDSFYVVVSGMVRIMRGQAYLADIRAGEHFGELALARPHQRSATVRAMTQTHLFSLSRQRFHELLKRKPELSARLAIKLMDTVGMRLRELTERLSRVEKAVRGE